MSFLVSGKVIIKRIYLHAIPIVGFTEICSSYQWLNTIKIQNSGAALNPVYDCFTKLDRAMFSLEYLHGGGQLFY